MEYVFFVLVLHSAPTLDLSLRSSMVLCYRDNSISEENFIWARKKSISKLLSMADTTGLLVTSPPCTGKTSLCVLLLEELRAQAKDFVYVDFAHYHPMKGTISSDYSAVFDADTPNVRGC
jgi:hypothetical protein